MERTGNPSVRLGHRSLEHCGADWQSGRAAGTGHRNTAERTDNRSVRLEQVTGTLRSGLTIGACGLATGVLAGAELKAVIKLSKSPNKQTSVPSRRPAAHFYSVATETHNKNNNNEKPDNWIQFRDLPTEGQLPYIH